MPRGIVIGEGQIASDLAHLLGSEVCINCRVEHFSTTADVLSRFSDVPGSKSIDEQVVVVVAVISENMPDADSLLQPIVALDVFKHSRIMVMTTSLEVQGVSWLANEGRLDWMGYAHGLNQTTFIEDVHGQISRFEEHQIPGSAQRASSLFESPHSDSVIIEKVLDQIEMSLGKQPRIIFPPSTRLTIKDQWVDEVTLILDGRVALIHESPGGDIVMHEESTGRIIGLLAVSEGRKALLNAVTTTEVKAVRLTVEQLNKAIEARADIALLVATLFVRSLDRRLRRAEQLHIENAELSEQLATERSQLRTALSNLEDARTELVAQERMVSLGTLAAGVAHELNNPLAAINRITDYLRQDVTTLIEGSPGEAWASSVLAIMSDALDAAALSTREERHLRSELTKITGDAQIAQRLSLSGIRDTQLVRGLSKKDGLSLDEAEKAASIGTHFRSLSSASERITALVASLRSYARPDGGPSVPVDVRQSLDDAIRLLSHKLDAVDVVRDYSDVPQVAGLPGQLAQVWTNLITNAAEAIIGEATTANTTLGTITIRVHAAQPGLVQVEIKDDGEGIPEDVLPHVFEPRFTTKAGQVRFGLGIGLGVSRSIIGNHHGTMRIQSTKEGTSIVVDLPSWAEAEEK